MKSQNPLHIFSGLPIRQVLQLVEVHHKTPDTQVALEIILGVTPQTKEARTSSHLTHATDISHQIRFPLKDRVIRALSHLAQKVALALLENSITKIETFFDSDDFISSHFFIALQSMGIEVKNKKESSQFFSVSANHLLRHEELEVLQRLENPDSNQKYLWTFSRERVYSGDYKTAYQILIQISPEKRTDSVHHLLGLCCNFFSRTNESEEHFKKMIESPVPLSQVKASYLLAMLYLRMHASEKLNLDIAEKYLIYGSQVIEKNPQIEDNLFHHVFNRNGYALCLFRRNKVRKALAMLDDGISRLAKSNDGAKNLHGSVLIYNSIQCLRQMKLYAQCEVRCHELLEIDPLFPEYWMELARTYLEQSKSDQALHALKQAEHLDPLIPEIYALRGYLYLEINQIAQARDQYRLAIEYNPLSEDLNQDLEYCLHLLGDQT